MREQRMIIFGRNYIYYQTKRMQRRQTLLVTCLALVALFAAAGCKKSKDSSASSQLSATIGGTAFEPSAVGAYNYISYVSITGIQVRSSDSVYLQVSVPITATAGSTVDFDEALVDYYDKQGTINYSSWYTPAHGSISLTTFDQTGKTIAGTFSGVLYSSNGTDSVKVENGKFNTSYTDY
jgi:hypothetical protein